MKLIALVIGIIILLLLIIKFKINTFVSLIVTAAITGVMLGMPVNTVPTSIMNGIGSQLGELSLVFGFGAMLGRLVSDSGGAYIIAETLINRFGKARLQIAVMIASFILGIALFFEVGMVLLVPIVFAIAVEAGVSILYLGIPMAAALSVTHGFLPPHPAPVAIAQVLGANDGTVLLYGFIIAIVAAYIAGPLWSRIAKKFAPGAFEQKGNLSSIGEVKEFTAAKSPSFGISVFTALFPVVLLLFTTIWNIIFNNATTPLHPHGFNEFVQFIGSPSIAMLIALFFAMWSMGWNRKRTTAQIMESLENAVKSIAMLLLIIGGGGAFKQVLIDGGVGKEVAKIFIGSSISPLILGWLVAVVLRLALGSATVASLTAAGIVAPLMTQAGVSPALMVLAIGAGSLAASHVNDAGFWMFKEYFDLSIKQTLQTWTALETIISVVGIIMVMGLSLFVH